MRSWVSVTHALFSSIQLRSQANFFEASSLFHAYLAYAVSGNNLRPFNMLKIHLKHLLEEVLVNLYQNISKKMHSSILLE